MKHDAKKFLPYPDLPIRMYTRFGIRKGFYSYMSPMGMYYATDCTHPYQNCNMNGCVEQWEYVDANNEGLVREDRVYHYFEGCKILEEMKKRKSFAAFRNKVIDWVCKNDFWLVMGLVCLLCLLAKFKEEGIIFNN